MDAARHTRRVLVTVALGGVILLVFAAPAFAGHDGDGVEGEHTCHLVDSNFADVEDDPVDDDTGTFYVCAGPAIPGGSVESGTGAGGRGDLGADDDGIVPAVRIDAGAGGAATAGNPALLAGVLTGATGAIGAVLARRRR